MAVFAFKAGSHKVKQEPVSQEGAKICPLALNSCYVLPHIIIQLSKQKSCRDWNRHYCIFTSQDWKNHLYSTEKKKISVTDTLLAQLHLNFSYLQKMWDFYKKNIKDTMKKVDLALLSVASGEQEDFNPFAHPTLIYLWNLSLVLLNQQMSNYSHTWSCPVDIFDVFC